MCLLMYLVMLFVDFFCPMSLKVRGDVFDVAVDELFDVSPAW